VTRFRESCCDRLRRRGTRRASVSLRVHSRTRGHATFASPRLRANVSPMARPLSIAVILTSALAFAGTTSAASRTQPSDRACLVAWNSSANQANRLRLLTETPIARIQLLPGVVGTDTVTNGSPPTKTAAPACLLTVAKPGEIRIVTGIWRTAGVSRWSFGHPTPTTKSLFANVRLLSDGRVTKIYHR
jgi:hypothetical protein